MFTSYLNTAAGSTLLILLKANEAPLREIKPIVKNILSNTRGEKENINPEFATPNLKPSNRANPIIKPTTVKSIACVKINLLIYLLPAPMAFSVP